MALSSGPGMHSWSAERSSALEERWRAEHLAVVQQAWIPATAPSSAESSGGPSHADASAPIATGSMGPGAIAHLPNGRPPRAGRRRRDALAEGQSTMSSLVTSDPLLTVPEVVEYLGGTVGESTIRRLIAAGNLRSVCVGARSRRIRVSEVEAYLSRAESP